MIVPLLFLVTLPEPKSYKTFSPAPGFTCLIPDLFGLTLDQTTNTTVNYMSSRLYQVFSSLFNLVLFRDSQRRSSLAALSFTPPTYATNHINAYDYMFAAYPANLRELQVVLQSVSAIVKDVAECKIPLGTYVADYSSPSIIHHGYSTYALPTWSHSETEQKVDRFENATTFNLVTEDARAQDIFFLQRPTQAIAHDHNVTDLIFSAAGAPDTDIPLPANHAIVRRFPFCLRLDNAAENGFPRHDNDDLVKFSDDTHSAPGVLVLDTIGDGVVSAHLPTLTGKIIESFELDGSTIEMPDTRKSLGMQNCMFADSAVAYKYVRPDSYWHPRPAGSILPPLNRALPNSRPRLLASSLLHDRTKVMLPQLNVRIHAALNDNALPGLTRVTPVNVVRYIQSFLGFRTVDSSNNAANLDVVPGMNEGLLMLWSPYTYTPYESGDYPFADLSASRHYYLTNLRTIFDTDYNLVSVKHPYEAFPVV